MFGGEYFQPALLQNCLSGSADAEFVAKASVLRVRIPIITALVLMTVSLRCAMRLPTIGPSLLAERLSVNRAKRDVIAITRIAIAYANVGRASDLAETIRAVRLVLEIGADSWPRLDDISR